MTVITRFAPSPTGLLHIGNIRTAIVNWLYTRKMNGNFILRMDDTDILRSKEEYAEQIQEDLKWIGLDWDNYIKQSDRLQRYEEVKQHLIDSGRLYPCFESQEELEIKRKMLLSRGKAPIYDRASLKLTDSEISSILNSGKKPHYRFKLENNIIKWNDLIKGDIHFEAKNISDPVVIRADGTMTYMLCSVIDDIDFNITHIIRGEDHVSNTAIHIQMFEALKSKIPNFGHLALISSKSGEISKRVGGFDISNLKNDGIEPLTIASIVSKMGTSDPIEPRYNLKELINEFDISKFNKSPTNYEKEDIIILNQKYIHHMPYEIANIRLKELGINNINQELWDAARGNIEKIADIKLWYQICEGEIEPQILSEDKEYLLSTISALPDEKLNENSWHKWIEGIKTISTRRGKDLFMPIRMALTGMDQGPEIKYLFAFISSRNKIISRLKGIKG